jgi:uncharacterized protein
MSRHKIALVLFILVGIGLGFVALNVEIFNRITLIDAKCERRAGEGEFTPNNFKDVDDRTDTDTATYFMESYETVSFPSRDNVTISGFFIPAIVSSTSTTETVIIVHGFNDCKRRPFSLLPAGMLHRNQMNALVIDLHNHGDSEVTTARMTGGVNEAMDILGAWDWLVDEKGIAPEKIGILGYSLGGATTIQAMSVEPRIVAGWVDSPFDKMESILDRQLEKQGLPTFLSASVFSIGQILYGVDLTSNTPEQTIQHVRDRPLYMVYSKDDELVPFDNVQTLIQNIESEERESMVWVNKGIKHVEVMLYHTEEYEVRMIEFFRQSLNPST